jgi:hypothetical protein
MLSNAQFRSAAVHPSYTSDRPHDPFGWLKTLGLIVLVFALMIGTGVLAAKADGCAAGCRARHDQCRIATKGSPSCDAQLQACIRGCVPGAARLLPPGQSGQNLAPAQAVNPR